MPGINQMLEGVCQKKSISYEKWFEELKEAGELRESISVDECLCSDHHSLHPGVYRPVPRRGVLD